MNLYNFGTLRRLLERTQGIHYVKSENFEDQFFIVLNGDPRDEPPSPDDNNDGDEVSDSNANPTDDEIVMSVINEGTE